MLFFDCNIRSLRAIITIIARSKRIEWIRLNRIVVKLHPFFVLQRFQPTLKYSQENLQLSFCACRVYIHTRHHIHRTLTNTMLSNQFVIILGTRVLSKKRPIERCHLKNTHEHLYHSCFCHM